MEKNFRYNSKFRKLGFSLRWENSWKTAGKEFKKMYLHRITYGKWKTQKFQKREKKRSKDIYKGERRKKKKNK